MRATSFAVLALLTFAPAAMAVDEVNTAKFDGRDRQRHHGARACAAVDRERNGGTRASNAGLRCVGHYVSSA